MRTSASRFSPSLTPAPGGWWPTFVKASYLMFSRHEDGCLRDVEAEYAFFRHCGQYWVRVTRMPTWWAVSNRVFRTSSAP